MTNLFLLGAFCLVVNIPMGVWRAGTKKFSPLWFAAIHAPVPIIILIRVISGISYTYIPFFIILSVIGQFVGGRLRFSTIVS
jgi:hypothetical protein